MRRGNPQLDENGRLRHFLSTEGLNRAILTEILDSAESFASVPPAALQLRLSFPPSVAAERIGAAGQALYGPALIGADVAVGIDHGLREQARLDIRLASELVAE